MSRGAPVTRRAVRWVDQRTASAPLLRKALRYLFPDHWSFLLGEVALYAFIVLVATGIYLTFFFVDSTKEVVFHGDYYPPLYGQRMSEAYASVVHLSLAVRAESMAVCSDATCLSHSAFFASAFLARSSLPASRA